MIRHVAFKLPGARKVREFIVYPATYGSDDGMITIQADDAIARFNAITGAGRFAVNAGGAYAPHLILKGRPITFPAAFIEECRAAQPRSGDEIAPGMRIV